MVRWAWYEPVANKNSSPPSSPERPKFQSNMNPRAWAESEVPTLRRCHRCLVACTQIVITCLGVGGCGTSGGGWAGLLQAVPSSTHPPEQLTDGARHIPHLTWELSLRVSIPLSKVRRAHPVSAGLHEQPAMLFSRGGGRYWLHRCQPVDAGGARSVGGRSARQSWSACG